MKKEKKITGSILAKVVAFFLLGISTIATVALIGVLALLTNAGAYDYQSREKCVEAVAREMMEYYAWNDMHLLRAQYDTDGEKSMAEYCRDTNFTMELYVEEMLVWSNYGGKETPYSFRYIYYDLIEEAIGSDNVKVQERECTIRLYVDPDFPVDDEYCTIYNRATSLSQGRYEYPVAAFLCLLLSISCFIFLMCSAGHKNGKEGITPGVLTAVHFDILTFIFGFVALLAFALVENSIGYLYGADELWKIGLVSVVAGMEVVWCTIYCMDLAIRLKVGKWWKHTLIAASWRLVRKIAGFLWRGFSALVKGFPLVVNVVLLYCGICVAEVLGMFFLAYNWNFVIHSDMLLFMLLEKIVLFVVVMYIALVCKKLQAGSRALAEGDLSYKLDTSKMLFSFKEHGENLNRIGEGISKAVAERMKSEHLKTELITNVSHDLKTPLTSIINYADLLAHEVQQAGAANKEQDAVGEASESHDQNEKVAEYAEVLYRQSKRLKKLLEDLVEASKATTGALEVNPEPCEIGVLLSQAVGEYEQRFAEKQMNLIVRQPEEPVRIMADGRHLWRVFDNLLNNIYKYAQENSRVYLSVEKKESQVEIIFRNMSKYALDIPPQELEERFVRGDKSRHMEGNGLGLSIAKSLVELQNGKMEIVTDGDLFKVILYFGVI